jgi:hypothetical protein
VFAGAASLISYKIRVALLIRLFSFFVVEKYFLFLFFYSYMCFSTYYIALL